MLTECVFEQKLSDLQNAGYNASKIKMCIHNLVSIKPTYACCKVYDSSSLNYQRCLLCKQNYSLSHLDVSLQNTSCYHLVMK